VLQVDEERLSESLIQVSPARSHWSFCPESVSVCACVCARVCVCVCVCQGLWGPDPDTHRRDGTSHQLQTTPQLVGELFNLIPKFSTVSFFWHANSDRVGPSETSPIHGLVMNDAAPGLLANFPRLRPPIAQPFLSRAMIDDAPKGPVFSHCFCFPCLEKGVIVRGAGRSR